MANAYLVVRIKGQADCPYWATHTMMLLQLDKKYRATILPARDNTLGMLRKVQHYVSWIELDASLAKELLDKKAKVTSIKLKDIPKIHWVGRSIKIKLMMPNGKLIDGICSRQKRTARAGISSNACI